MLHTEHFSFTIVSTVCCYSFELTCYRTFGKDTIRVLEHRRLFGYLNFQDGIIVWVRENHKLKMLISLA